MALEVEDNSGFSCYLKWIHWNRSKIPIIMQSRNGPCPLIATLNVLLLREKVKLPSMLEQITADQLLTYLGECIMDFLPPTPATATTSISDKPEQEEEPTIPRATTMQVQEQLQSQVSQEGAIINLEQHIHDAMEILPKLKTGLDVNVRFTSITDFEYTPECIIFDLLRIPLYHGWIIDPDLTELQLAIGNQSYNQLVDSLVTNKNSSSQQEEDDESVARTTTNMVMIESFLEQTASQLTHYGLEELRNKIQDNELGILFRNNHFLTLFKRDGDVYTLVTDHGYLTEDTVVWEILDSVEGAGRFFDSNFQESQVSSNARVLEQKIIADEKQFMDDLIMALSLEDEERVAAVGAQGTAPPHHHHSQPPPPSTINDLELAKKLQAEWDSQYAESLWSATNEQASSSSTTVNDNVTHNPSPTTATATTSSRDWQQVSTQSRHMAKSAGALSNELDHESTFSANEPFVVAETSSEPCSQLVVVACPAPTPASYQVSEQTTATWAHSRPVDSTGSASGFTTTTTTAAISNATTSLTTNAASRPDHLTMTTAKSSSAPSRGLRSNNSETKNSKESNCIVS